MLTTPEAIRMMSTRTEVTVRIPHMRVTLLLSMVLPPVRDVVSRDLLPDTPADGKDRDLEGYPSRGRTARALAVSTRAPGV
jgi:hypothetical protein